MQDDRLGDPEVGGLSENLLADMAAAMGGEDSLDEASIEASIEDGEDSSMEEIEGDTDSLGEGLDGTEGKILH
jgi:hypothetical protein